MSKREDAAAADRLGVYAESLKAITITRHAAQKEILTWIGYPSMCSIPLLATGVAMMASEPSTHATLLGVFGLMMVIAALFALIFVLIGSIQFLSYWLKARSTDKAKWLEKAASSYHPKYTSSSAEDIEEAIVNYFEIRRNPFKFWHRCWTKPGYLAWTQEHT